MIKEPEDLTLTRSSAMFLEAGHLSEACDLFDFHAKNVNYSQLNKKQKKLFLMALYSWVKNINSEQARELIRYANVNKKNLSELHYYILALKKKHMYPLLPITYLFS